MVIARPGYSPMFAAVNPFNFQVLQTLAQIGTAATPYDIARKMPVPATAEDVRGVLVGAKLPGGSNDMWRLLPSKLKMTLQQLNNKPRFPPVANPSPPPRARRPESLTDGDTGGRVSLRLDPAEQARTRSTWAPSGKATIRQRSAAIRELWEGALPGVYRGRTARFSEIFGITRGEDDDWFDVIPSVDSPLYIDPFLVFSDPDPLWAGSEELFTSFFRTVADLLRAARGNVGSRQFEQARELLHFREPREFALGVAVGHPSGSGTGAKLATEMAKALDDAMGRGLKSVERPEMLSLLCEGIGLDRTSDITGNILKPLFITYTQRVAERHGLPVDHVEIQNASWSSRGWSTSWLKLPAATLLVPQRFLKNITEIEPAQLFDWATSHHNEELRAAVNTLIATKIIRKEKLTLKDRDQGGRDFARTHPQLALAFVKATRSDPNPYDVASDPLLLVRWLEIGRNAALTAPKLDQPGYADAVPVFVEKAIESLKTAIERDGLWKAFWDSFGHSRPTQLWMAVCASYLSVVFERAGVKVENPFEIGRAPFIVRTADHGNVRVTLHFNNLANTRSFAPSVAKTPTRPAERGIVALVAFAITSDLTRVNDPDGPVQSKHRDLAARAVTALQPVVIDARTGTW